MSVNCETCALLQHWDFYAKKVDEACDLFDWLAWNTYEFETNCSYFYISPLRLEPGRAHLKAKNEPQPEKNPEPVKSDNLFKKPPERTGRLSSFKSACG